MASREFRMIRANRPQWAGAIAAVSILVVLGYGQAAAQDHAHDSGGTLGTVHFETSCNASVQAEFDRAVAMLHSFFYPETEKAFRAIAELSLIHISEPTRLLSISYAVFCLKK